MKKVSLFSLQRRKTKGFTLIEILTVVSILAVIGSICVGIVTITLRTAKKADLIEVARQNGDTVLTQMVRNIRYAAILNNPATCVPTTTVSTITITSLTTHLATTYTCVGNTINTNGVSMFNTTTLNVSTCSFVCQQPTANDPPTITIQYTLTPASAGLFAESKFTVPFQSSVTMRNLENGQ